MAAFCKPFFAIWLPKQYCHPPAFWRVASKQVAPYLPCRAFSPLHDRQKEKRGGVAACPHLACGRQGEEFFKPLSGVPFLSLIIFIGMAVTVFLTSLLSGIFGMAGGLILLWVLLFLYPVGTAIAIQGVIQMVSNGSRAWFSRRYIDWRILSILCAGVAVSAVILFLTNYTPSLIVVLIGVGLMPILVWLPVNRLQLDASRPSHAFLAGLLSGAMTISVGVAGPTIDIFFIRTQMDRRKIIATKASIQTLSHLTKIAFYWDAASSLPTVDTIAVLIAAPVAILGALAGNGILQKMTDANFRAWTRWVVTGVGAVYLAQGLMKLI